MKEDKQDGGQAFPSFDRLTMVRGASLDAGLKEKVYYESTGMSLRDYFASKAMSSLIAIWKNVDDIDKFRLEATALSSYHVADAMLKAREQ
jgi:hypothetical protein